MNEPVPQTNTLDTREVAGKGKRSRRKRTTVASTVRRIDASARERQEAWLETDRPLVTYRLTRELDELYGDLRAERRGAYSSGDLREGLPVAEGDPSRVAPATTQNARKPRDTTPEAPQKEDGDAPPTARPA